MFADDKFLGNRKEHFGNNVYFWNGSVVGDVFFQGTSKYRWLFWACLLFAHWSPLSLCDTWKGSTDMWLWRSHGPALQGSGVCLGIGTWMELNRKVIIGPAVRKLVRWSPGSSPHYNPLVSLRSDSSSLPVRMLTRCCSHGKELMDWKKKTTLQTVK